MTATVATTQAEKGKAPPLTTSSTLAMATMRTVEASVRESRK